jgi:hypothetical protein
MDGSVVNIGENVYELKLAKYWLFMQLTIFILVVIRNLPLNKQDGNARTNSIHTMIFLIS